MSLKSFTIHPRKYEDVSIEPRYFKFKELIFTGTLLPNYPTTFTEIANLRALADFLDTIRDELGFAIFVNSAYRTFDVNCAVGGACRSLHMQGRAADIWPAYGKEEELIDILRKHRTELAEFIVNRDKKYIHIAI